jgi:endoglucanase
MQKYIRSATFVVAMLFTALLPSHLYAQLLRGVNLSGAEFGSAGSTKATSFGTLGKHYIYPTDQMLDFWFKSVGVDVVRVPFRWERVQSKLGGALNGTELRELDRIVARAKGAGKIVILDMHNYGSRWVITGGGMKQGQVDGESKIVTRTHFADVWRRIAARYRDQKHVQFDLMNEPHDMRPAGAITPAQQTGDMYQAAISAIRASGAKNVLHVEPSNWGKPSALTGGFSAEALALKDPANNLVFHLHQYIDFGEQGDDPSLMGDDLDAGVKRLKAATEWARKHKKKLFLGEFGLANANARQITAVRRMIAHVEANSDVWRSWTAWGAGMWWPTTYHFALEPTKDGKESAGLKALRVMVK